jgi:hypothetical protein
MGGSEDNPVEQENLSAAAHEPPKEPEARDLPQQLEAAIRQRAYEISQGADAGTPEENWRRAELEVSAGAHDDSDVVRRDELAAAADEEASALLHARIGALGHP